MPDSEAYRKGSEMRRKLLGDAYVERANKTTYDDPTTRKFIDVVTETVFGTLWTRPGLDLKTRTLVCVVSDAATGQEPELAIHLRMALRQGWTEEELTEVLLHLSGYVGAPLVREAFLGEGLSPRSGGERTPGASARRVARRAGSQRRQALDERAPHHLGRRRGKDHGRRQHGRAVPPTRIIPPRKRQPRQQAGEE